MYDINEITLSAGATRVFSVSENVAGIALVAGDANYQDGSPVPLNSIIQLEDSDVEVTATTECVIGVVTLLPSET
jgi:hypothetical protein